MTAVGLVGLGNMGSALAGNLLGGGLELVTHDRAGADGNPEGAQFRSRVADVARDAAVMVLSLPDGDASAAVVAEVLATTDRRVGYIIDTSTVGHLGGSRPSGPSSPHAGMGYVDAPVSGGGRGSGSHPPRDVRRSLRRVRSGRAGPRRPQRSAPAGGGPAGHGASGQARQQLPVGHRARRPPARRWPSPRPSASTWPPCSTC